MPKSSTWTELLGPALLEQVDAVGDAIKDLVGWPPLGVSELSPSGARARAGKDAELLADFLLRLPMPMAASLMEQYGQQLTEQFGPEVVMGAARRVWAEHQRRTGGDGRETFTEGGD